jgi:hypothetical protein
MYARSIQTLAQGATPESRNVEWIPTSNELIREGHLWIFGRIRTDKLTLNSERASNLAHGVLHNATSGSGSVSSSSPHAQPGFQPPSPSHIQQLALPTHASQRNSNLASEEKWLVLEPLSLDPASWSLGMVVVEQQVVLDLFKQ